MIIKDREIIDLFEIEAILNDALVCRIGLADGDEPYIVPLCFGYKDKTIYLHSAMNGKKLRYSGKIPGVVLKLTCLITSSGLSVHVPGEYNTEV